MAEIRGHDCDAPVGVIVHNAVHGENAPEFVNATEPARIPVVDSGITLHERKDGPTAITRRAEIEFPFEGLGESWIDYIDAFSEDGGLQKCTVKMRPHNLYQVNDNITKEEEQDLGGTIFTGYIGAIGTSGENVGHLSVFGPYKLLNSIPIGTTFQVGGIDGSLRPILDWIRERFENGQYIFGDVELNIVGLEEDEDIDLTRSGVSNKTFSANRDTLVDAVSWVFEELGLKLWFEPGSKDNNITLVAEPRPKDNVPGGGDTPAIFGTQVQTSEVQRLMSASGRKTETFDATGDGTITIVENDALYEMKPYNGLRLDGGQLVKEVQNQYPEAKAWYPPLVERSGGKLFIEKNSQKVTPGAVEQQARQELKEALDSVSGGTMDLVLSPFITPYDKIIAQPGCAGNYQTNLPELRYEVQRTAHKIKPDAHQEGNPVFLTEIAVSMSIDPSKIKSTSTVKSDSPSKGTPNEPTNDDFINGSELTVR